MKRIIVAPHPDDEILGCYSVLPGSTVIYVTEGNDEQAEAIQSTADILGFTVVQLGLPECDLDNRLSQIIGMLSEEITGADEVYIPSDTDYHSDHQMVAKACRAVLKPWKKLARRVCVYEIPSETPPGFTPAVFRLVSGDQKARAMLRHYPQEVIESRSEAVIRALARVRGGQGGLPEAEAFELWYDRRAEVSE